MASPKPRLVVIDDSPEFLAELAPGLDARFDPLLLHFDQPGQDVPGLITKIREHKPDHLVLDLTLGHRAGLSYTLLRTLERQAALPVRCAIWIISQAGQEEATQTLETFETIDSRVKDRILAKPISAQQLSAELTDRTEFPMPTWMLDFPLPLRVLANTGKVLAINQHWFREDSPPPQDFCWDPEQAPPSVPQHYTGSFSQSRDSSFDVHPFLLEQGGQQLLGQVVTSHPLERVPLDLNATLTQIFTAMARRGFSHSRFYRIRLLDTHAETAAYDRVLELTHCFPPLNQGKLPLCLPLTGVLKKRIQDYADRLRDKTELQELEYSIELKDISTARDKLIVQLHEFIGIEGKDSWVEVPVRLRLPERDANYSDPYYPYRIMGLLVFDRRRLPDSGHSNSPVSADRPAMDSEVTEPNLAPVKPLLRSLLDLLAAALHREMDAELVDYELAMRQMDHELLATDKASDRFEIILKTMQKLGHASSGMMVILDEPDQKLEMVATGGEQPPNFLADLRLPLNADHHPIVKAWKCQKPFVWQNFSESEQCKELLDKLAQSPPLEYLKEIPPAGLQDFSEWVGQIKALMAIPVVLPPQQTIGGITLQFDQPYRVNRRLREKLDAILHRARWVLQQYHANKSKHDWHSFLSHDLKGITNLLWNGLDDLRDERPDLNGDEDFQQLRLGLMKVRDLTHRQLDAELDLLNREPEDIHPGDLLTEALQLYQPYMEQEQARVQQSPEDWQAPEWTIPLRGNQDIFSAALRVLLDNAIKFGRYHLGLSEPITPLTLVMEAHIKDGYWHFRLLNPGQLSEEAYRLRFIAGRAPRDQKTTGSNQGLSVTRRWVRQFGGDLSLKNADSERVAATLSWPIIDQPKPRNNHHA